MKSVIQNKEDHQCYICKNFLNVCYLFVKERDILVLADSGFIVVILGMCFPRLRIFNFLRSDILSEIYGCRR